MAGLNEVTQAGSKDAHVEHQADAHSAHGCASHLHSDCDLSDPGNRPNTVRVAAIDVDPKTATALDTGVAKPENQAPVQDDARSQNGGLDDFLKAAPAAYRRQIGLPADASSKDFVGAYIHEQAEQIEHSPKEMKDFRLRVLGLDEKTTREINEHRPGSEENLEKILTEKEKQWLEIPATLKGDALYKKMEDGMLRDDYRAQVDIDKIRAFKGWQ